MLLCLAYAANAHALAPAEVLVVANMNAAQSRGLAKYYMRKRHIPEKNLVLLFMTDRETCSREEYTAKAVPPIRRFLDKNSDIRAVVTIFGVPLRIAPAPRTRSQQERLNAFETRKKTLEARPDSSDKQDPEKLKQLAALQKQKKSYLRTLDTTASFDSELALVKKHNYRLEMWQPNPYYLGFRGMPLSVKKSEVLMTARLDAATPAIVKRIIDDSIEAEKKGLEGKAYFDARWKDPGKKKLSGYAFYDRSIHLAAHMIAKNYRIPVVIDDSSALFQKGQCPDAALYCGWYSLARYIDAFTWSKGSVGYHIASSECSTLKSTSTKVWCKKMLDNGIAATIGPVGEPYVQAFPVPEIFFKYLAQGYLSLAESYLVSLPYLSWKMVLVGDPLYHVNLKK